MAKTTTSVVASIIDYKIINIHNALLAAVYVDWGYIWDMAFLLDANPELSTIESSQAISSTENYSFEQIVLVDEVGVPIWGY